MSTHLKIVHWAVVTFWIRNITFQIKNAKLKKTEGPTSRFGNFFSAQGVSMGKQWFCRGIKIAESIALSVFVKTSNFLEILFSPDNQSQGFVSADAQLRCHCPMSTLTAVDLVWWGWLVKRWGGLVHQLSFLRLVQQPAHLLLDKHWTRSCASTTFSSSWWTREINLWHCLCSPSSRFLPTCGQDAHADVIRSDANNLSLAVSQWNLSSSTPVMRTEEDA